MLAAGLAGFAGWSILTTGEDLAELSAAALHALWLLPALLILHLFQLFLSSVAWQKLLPSGQGLRRLYPLRIVREAIDSLLPVAQIGGEIVAARLLAQGGLSLAVTGASVVVDVTLEFLTQLVFLLLGVFALGLVSPSGAWQAWIGAALLSGCGAAGLVAVQRLGGLRLLERLSAQIAARWPGIGSLAGIDAAAAALYRRRGSLLSAGGLHLLAWVIGTAESWSVLRMMGFELGAADALVIESLGMAARSAGFAVPGAVVVQETGFALAAAAAGLPEGAGVSLSLVKRVREVAIGLFGLLLWRLRR